MTPRKRSILRRLFGLKPNDEAERRHRAAIDRADATTAEADAMDRERAQKRQAAQQKTNDSTDRVTEQTCTLNGVLERARENGKRTQDLARSENLKQSPGYTERSA